MNKKVNYMDLLKESVADRGHDTTQSVDVKGPFLDPILGYDGGGELPTFKDAASILERYYFKGDSDPGVTVSTEMEIGGPDPDQDPAAKHHDAAGNSLGNKKDGGSETDIEGAKAKAAKAVKQEDEDLDGDIIEEDEDLLEDDVENAVIERLISEMEEDDDLLEEDEDLLEDDDYLDEIGGPDPDQDPAAPFHEPSGIDGGIAGKAKKAKEDIITGDDHSGGEDVVEAMEIDDMFNELLEDDDMTAGGEETPKDLDADKETDTDDDSEEVKEAAMGPLGHPHDAESYENLDEQFEIFKEAMEDDDAVELDPDEDIVV